MLKILLFKITILVVLTSSVWAQKAGVTDINTKGYIWMADTNKVTSSRLDIATEFPFQYTQLKVGVGPNSFASLDDHGVFWIWSKLNPISLEGHQIDYSPYRITLGKYWIDFDVSSYVKVLLDSSGQAYQWGDYLTENFFDAQKKVKQKDSLTLISGNVQIQRVYSGQVVYGVSRTGALYKAINGSWVEVLHADNSSARVLEASAFPQSDALIWEDEKGVFYKLRGLTESVPSKVFQRSYGPYINENNQWIAMGELFLGVKSISNINGTSFAFTDKNGSTWSNYSLDKHPIETNQRQFTKDSITYYEVKDMGTEGVARTHSMGMVWDSNGTASVWGFESDEIFYTQSNYGGYKLKALWGEDNWTLLDMGLIKNSSNETFWAGQNLSHSQKELYNYENFPLVQTSVNLSSLWGLDAKGRIWHNGQNNDISGMTQTSVIDTLILFEAQEGAKHLTRTNSQIYWISAEDTLYVQGYFMGQNYSSPQAIAELNNVKQLPNGMLRDSMWTINSGNQLQKIVFTKSAQGVFSVTVRAEISLPLADGTGFVKIFDNYSEFKALTDKGYVYRWTISSDVPTKVLGGAFKHMHSSVSSSCYVGADSTLWYSGKAGLDSNQTDPLIRKARFGKWNSCYASYTSVIAERTDGTLWAFTTESFSVNKSGGFIFPMPMNSGKGYSYALFQGNANATNTQIIGSVNLLDTTVVVTAGNPTPAQFSYWPFHSNSGLRVDKVGTGSVMNLNNSALSNGSAELLRDLDYLDPSIHLQFKVNSWVASSASGWGYGYAGLYYPFKGATEEGFDFKENDQWTFILDYPQGDTLSFQLELNQGDEQQTYDSPPRYRYVGKGQKDTLKLRLSEFKREGWSSTFEIDLTQIVGLKLYKLVMANTQGEVFPSYVDTISAFSLWCFSTALACEGDYRAPGFEYDQTKLEFDFSKIQASGQSLNTTQLVVPDVDVQSGGSSQVLNMTNEVFGYCTEASNSFYDASCSPIWDMSTMLQNDILSSKLQVRGSYRIYEAYTGWWFMPKHNGDLSAEASKGALNLGLNDSSIVEVVFKAPKNEVLALRLGSDSLINNLKTFQNSFGSQSLYKIKRYFLMGEGDWVKARVPVSLLLTGSYNESPENISMIWLGRYVANADGVLGYGQAFPTIMEKMPLEIACLGVGEGVCDNADVIVNKLQSPKLAKPFSSKKYNAMGQLKNGTTVKFSPLKSYGEINLNSN